MRQNTQPQPRRLIGRYLDHKPIELIRETTGSLLTQNAINAATAFMGPGWDVWIERPFSTRNISNPLLGVS